MPEHSVNEAFLYPVFLMPLDFSKFRVKRDWSHGLRCHKEDPPECWEGKSRDPWVPEKSGLTRRMEAWSGVAVGLKTGVAGTHCYLLEGAGLTAFGCCFNIYFFIWLCQVLVAA